MVALTDAVIDTEAIAAQFTDQQKDRDGFAPTRLKEATR